jgi:putative ABC transport system permease protein
MYLLTNAAKNLVRNKGRNILIAAVTFAIIVSAVVTLTINNAAAKIINDIRLDLGSRVEVRQDFIEMRQAGLDARQDRSFVSIDDFYSYADSNYIRKTIFNAVMYAWSDTFYAIDDYDRGMAVRDKNDGSGETMFVETFKLIGTSEPDALADFGTLREITSGRMFDGLNECVISEDMAVLNGISIGDVIRLRGAYATDKDYSLTVAGIYSDYTDEYVFSFFAMYNRFADNRRNEVLASWATLMSAGWETNAGLDMKSEYFLKDPDKIREFEEEVRGKGLPITYNVAINQAAYDKVTGPLSGMKNAAVAFMIVILILGAIVLALLSFMAVRERKYEVGVLRAMGMERGKVAFGIISEAMIISILCLIIGLGIGNAISQPIADNMLEGRVAAAESNSGDGRQLALFAGGQFQTNADDSTYIPESEIQVRLGADTFIQIIILTLCLAALSGIIGVVIITRYEPLRILRERS